jgi:hypothetical protein
MKPPVSRREVDKRYRDSDLDLHPEMEYPADCPWISAPLQTDLGQEIKAVSSNDVPNPAIYVHYATASGV